MVFTENPPNTGDITLQLSTSANNPVSVSLTTPRTSSPNVNRQVTVQKGAPVHVTLPAGLRVTNSGRSDKAVLIKSTGGEVAINAVNIGSCGSYLALPMDSLGTQYMALTWDVNSGESQVAIVARDPNTFIRVIMGPTANVFIERVRYTGSQTLTMALNEHEILHIQSDSDLSGTLVISNNPVVVLAGNSDVSIGNGIETDQIISQMAPIETWGTNFILTGIPNMVTPYYVKVVSNEDNNLLLATDTSTRAYALKKAEAVTFQANANMEMYLKSTKPLQVIQYVPSKGQASEWSAPAALLIPPVQQYMDDYFFSIGGDEVQFTHYLILVVETQFIDRLFYNVLPITTDNWVPVFGTDPAMSSKVIEIRPGTHRVQVGQAGLTFGAYVYGSETLKCAYAFPAGMLLLDLSPEVSWCSLSIIIHID